MFGLEFEGVNVGAPQGVVVKNFHHPDVPAVKTRGVIKEHKWIVLHENAGTANVHKFLPRAAKAKFTYNVVVDIGGVGHQLADLNKVVYHGNQLCRQSVGIVFLNGYYPDLAYYRQDIMDAQWWTHRRKGCEKGYAELSYAQKLTAERLLPFMADVLGIPYEFPTAELNKRRPRIDNWKLRGKPKAAGIVAHRDFSWHADGRYLLEHLIAQQQEENAFGCPTCGRTAL